MGRPSSLFHTWGREGAKKAPASAGFLADRGRIRAHKTKATGRSACTLSMLLYAAGGLPAFVYCWGPLRSHPFPGTPRPPGPSGGRRIRHH